MEFRLVTVAGQAQQAGQALQNELRLKPPVVIGRSRDADITIANPMVSRRHCKISENYQTGSLMVEDLGSLNGTFVGAQRITMAVPLKPGTVLTVGSVSFQAIYGDYTPDQSAPSTKVPEPDFTEAFQQYSSPATVDRLRDVDLADVETDQDLEGADPPTQTLDSFTNDTPSSSGPESANGDSQPPRTPDSHATE